MIELKTRNPSKRTMKLHQVSVDPPLMFRYGDGTTSASMPRSDLVEPLKDCRIKLELVTPEDFKSEEVGLWLDVASSPNGKRKRYYVSEIIKF